MSCCRNSLGPARCSNVHFQLIRADGSLLDVLLSAVLQRDPSGHVMRSLSVMEDISQTLADSTALKRKRELRLELEERAAELDALLSERNEMLYVLAHEVRQPMNNASAVLQNAASLLAERGQEREALRIGKAQQLMGRILRNLLANALRYSPAGAAVTLTIADSDELLAPATPAGP